MARRCVRGGGRVGEEGRIAAVGSVPVTPGARVVDCRGLCMLPGLVDARPPARAGIHGEGDRGDGYRRRRAHGGYTVVCPMPNLSPAPDTPEHLAVELEAIRRDAAVRTLPYAAITRGQKGRGELVDFEALAPLAVAFSDDGRGVQEGALMEEAMRRAAAVGKPIVAHCEAGEGALCGGCIHDGEILPCARPQGAFRPRASGDRWSATSSWRRRPAAATACATSRPPERGAGAPCQGPRPGGELRDRAPLPAAHGRRPARGGALRDESPLRSAADRAALREGIADGTIEVLATDHAPPIRRPRSRAGLAGSAMGIVGLGVRVRTDV